MLTNFCNKTCLEPNLNIDTLNKASNKCMIYDHCDKMAASLRFVWTNCTDPSKTRMVRKYLVKKWKLPSRKMIIYVITPETKQLM